MTILCLGDLVLDVIVRLEQPLATGADATSKIVLRPGGQAANVAAWVAALGGTSRFVGKRGADDAGALAASRLLELGVELAGPVEPAGNGVIVSLVDPAGERTMCADRGVAAELRPEEIDEAWFADCEHLHVSGYALLREPVRFAAIRAIELARAAGSAGQHRPLVLERDPRLRRGAVPRPARGARARRRLRERGGGPDRRRPASRAAPGSSSAAPPAPRSTASSAHRTRRGGRRLDRGGRRLRRRLARRRAGPRSRGRRALRAAGRLDAATRQSARLAVMRDLIHVSDEVQTALEEERAVVALETTLVAHGFPAPDGVETGLASEAAVRAAGAVPATIGVLDGQIRIGLEQAELERFTPRRASSARATSPSARCRARSARRRSAARSRPPPRSGSGSWARAASAASTAAFRRRPTSRPTSPPPHASRPSIASSGVKSLLDVPATVELLETLGVPVIGYRTDTLPLFYDAAGGPPVSARADDVSRDRPHRRRPLAARRQRAPRRPPADRRASTSRR